MKHRTYYEIQKRDVNNQTLFSMDSQSYDFIHETGGEYTIEDARCHRDQLLDDGGSAIPYRGFKRHKERLTSEEARLENLVIVQVTIYEDVVL